MTCQSPVFNGLVIKKKKHCPQKQPHSSSVFQQMEHYQQLCGRSVLHYCPPFISLKCHVCRVHTLGSTVFMIHADPSSQRERFGSVEAGVISHRGEIRRKKRHILVD